MKWNNLLYGTNIYQKQAYQVFNVILRKYVKSEHDSIDPTKTKDKFFSDIIGVFDNNIFDVKIKCAFIDAIIGYEKNILSSQENSIIYEKEKIDIDEVTKNLARIRNHSPIQEHKRVERVLSEKDKQGLENIRLIRVGLVERLQEYKHEIKNIPIEKGNVEIPFSSQEAINVFRYFDKWFKDNGKSKYTYIFNFMKERQIDSQLKERMYFNWIYQDPNNKDRLITSATSDNKYQDIQELYDRYLNDKSS